MLKADVNQGKCRVEAEGNVQTLCADITCIFHGILEGIDNDDAKETFKHAFTMGFDDGIVLGVSRKDMDSIRQDNAKRVDDRKDEIIDSMLDLMNALNALKRLVEEDDDEAE